MTVLIVGSEHPLAADLEKQLPQTHLYRTEPGAPVDLSQLGGVTAIVSFVPLRDLAPELVGHHTYTLLHAARAAGINQIVLASTLSLFATTPLGWPVDPTWRPAPGPEPDALRAWAAELCGRELARTLGLTVTCLRFGTPAVDARWPLDPQTAVAALLDALAQPSPGWSIRHVATAPADLVPTASPRPAPIPPRPLRRVAIFGAGGPLAAAIVQELGVDYQLRLLDQLPFAAISARGPDQPTLAGGPEPTDWRVVDVRDQAQVTAACADVDAIINCTVVRRDPLDAWLVNAGGALNIARAAVSHGIARLVHTGPFQVGALDALGYAWDAPVVEDAPPRPGGYWDLYFHTKLLGQELTRIYAEHYGLTVPALLFCNFVGPLTPPAPLGPFTVSWADAARAARAALTVPALPRPFELLHINADLPHGVFPNDKARRVLGWQPQNDLRALHRPQ